MADIEFEIDGKTLTAKPGETVMQVADAAGIYIPRFCYHKHLSIAANCRMCLVEVEKSPKTLPACATPVTPGMKVYTQSAKTIQAQRAVMEFLLINHPLDCPICDQGGECELQDLAMGYGSGQSHYDESKRAIADENLGPLIATDMTRCIYCTRCVRFGAEVAGVREMGGTFRGEDTQIGTYIQHVIRSEVSGNIIDLCPVGALTSKPFRFRARAWELDQAPSISPHDCLGSNLNVHTRYGKVMRVVARENTKLNETWLSDRDRFSYTGLHHAERLEEPRIRVDGEWQVVDWQRALEFAAEGLKTTIAEHGSDKFGALASPNSTLEEFYLLQKITRGLGSPHVDHRLREKDTSDQHLIGSYLGLPFETMPSLAESEVILLIGAHLQRELPLINLQVRKAALRGAKILMINPVDFPNNFVTYAKHIVAPHAMPAYLAKLTQAVTSTDKKSEMREMVEALTSTNKVTIILGLLALHDTHAASLRSYARQLATAVGGQVGYLTDGANSAGAWLAGAVPHRHVGGESINLVGLNAYEMLEKGRRAYLLLNVDPELDTANAHHAREALRQAKFTVAVSLYRNPVLEAHAHVILPMAAFTETSGTYVNALGDWQSFHGMANSYRECRPAWKILRVLGNFLQLDGFEYQSSEEVKKAVKQAVEKHQPAAGFSDEAFKANTATQTKLSRIGEIPLYALDSLVRHAAPLQTIQGVIDEDLQSVRIHPHTAMQLNLQEGDIAHIAQHTASINLPVLCDVTIAQDAVYIPGGLALTSGLGDLMGAVEVKKGLEG